MPKLKTRKAVAKRIVVTKRGKVKIRKPCRGHLLTLKSRKRKRHLKKRGSVSSTNAAKLRQMMPYR